MRNLPFCTASIAAVLLPAVLLPAAVSAQMCAVTPAEAARSSIGEAPHVAPSSTDGYRVVDVQIDRLMHRVWFRVGRCSHPGEPLILVPLRASLAGDQDSQRALVSLSAGADPSLSPPLPKPVAVHAGDAVTVLFASESVRMELRGTADAQAALDEPLAVTLPPRGQSPAQTVRGILRVGRQVEVQP